MGSAGGREAAAAPVSVDKACCQWMGIHGGQEAPADGNGKGSEDDGNEGYEESKGVKGNEGEGDEGDDGNFPEGGGRQWTQQSTRC